jgi:uncharacterized protein YxeA
MKKILVVIFIMCLGMILAACGEQDKYNEAIDSSIKVEKEYWKNNDSELEAKKITRKNSEVEVYDDGKYILLKFPELDYETEYKRKGNGYYELPTSDEREYMKNDAKLVYAEKNGKPQKNN